MSDNTIEMPETSDEEAAAPVTTDAMASALPDMLSALIPSAMEGLLGNINGSTESKLDIESLMLEVLSLKNTVEVLNQRLNEQIRMTAQVTNVGVVISIHTPFEQHATVIPTETMNNLAIEWLVSRDDVVTASIVKRVRERKAQRNQPVKNNGVVG